MGFLVLIALVLAGGVATTLVLSRLGVQRRHAVLAGVGAAIAGAALFVGFFLVAFEECLAENRDPAPPFSYPWSPRREFCGDGSMVQVGALALFLIPPALVIAGLLLRERGHSSAGLAVWGATAIVPFLPSLYVQALPYYELESYPVLHEPLLRPAAGSSPARVCYVYGVAHGPREIQVTPSTERTCIELEPTEEALALTTAYDEGSSIYDLDLVGDRLTEKGLPVEPGDTGVEGLTIERVYPLPDEEAQLDSQVVD